MPRETFVHEGIVGQQQIENAPVFANDAFEEQLGLATKGLAKIVVKVREQVGVGLNVPQVSQMQPLARKVFDKGCRFWVSQHASHFPLQRSRHLQASCTGGLEQLVIGNAAPEKKRKSRSQLDVGEAMRLMRLARGARGIAFHAKQKLGARQNTLQCRLNARFKASIAAAVIVETHEALQVGIGDRLAVCPASQRRNYLLCTG